ncbi:MAG: nuclear transport factor 2 family protein [Rhodobacterales bacterium]|nr:nuclear transport factor 2 family protein [Rhodobacterales bacterium]MDX5500691.1 nuclear transport factor 2 family protein [Rhodobacterales bacterium]
MTQTVLSEILAAETAVWQALVDGDAAADAAALAPGFLGVYPTGFAGRDDHVGQLAGGPSVAAFCLDDPRVLAPAPDLALLAYRATFRRPGSDAEETMFISSLWQRQGGGWINLFSQDTPAGPAVP